MNDLDKLEKEYPEIEITGLDSTFSEICTPMLRIIKDEFLKAVNQWYGEAEPEEGTISEVLHTVVAQYEYRNELIKDNKVGNIEDCAGIVVNTFIFQDRKYMPDDIVKVETDNGYNYILAKDLPKFVKNVEFSPCKYDPATTVLALDECFIIEDNTSIRLLELILRDEQSKEQKVIKTYQYLGQLHGIPATLFPTKVELTGRKVGVVCHNGVFSNYEI